MLIYRFAAAVGTDAVALGGRDLNRASGRARPKTLGEDTVRQGASASLLRAITRG